MTLSVSKMAILANYSIDWLDKLDKEVYQIDAISFLSQDFSEIAQKQYHLLLIQDDIVGLDLEASMGEVIRSQPLLSIIILTQNTDPEYSLRLIELGARDVFIIGNNSNHLIRRLNLVLKHNQTQRMSIRLTHDLNAVTILSRRLHDANHPNNLIVDALNIVSSTFNLMGLAIVLESGNNFHVRAGNSSRNSNRRVYDVMLQLHPYDPILQSIRKNIVFVFEDLSLNQYIAPIPIFDSLESAIIVPLSYSKMTLGALVVFGTATNPLTRDDIVIYEHLATHLGSAYQNVRDAYTQDVSAKTSRHLLRIWQRLSKVYKAQEVDEIMRALTSEIPNITNSLIWMYSETSSQPNINASNPSIINVFQNLYSEGTITEYINQFDTQLRPLTIWQGRSNTRNIVDLFQVMAGQQLIFIPVKDDARLLGCILASSNSNEPLDAENLSLLEGISHAAGQTLARNMLISYKDEQAGRLEAITRSIKDGVFFVTEHQEVVFCNPQFTELTGISPSQVLYQPVQSLIEKLVSQSNQPEQILIELESAIQQLADTSIDNDYPIVEIDIPKTQSQIYIEFISLSDDNNNLQKNWIGILSSHRMASSSFDISSFLMDSVVEHLQVSSKDIYKGIISLNNSEASRGQTGMLKQIQNRSLEIEQLLNNVQSLYQLNQSGQINSTWNDPNKLLSVILTQPTLRDYSKQLDIKTSIKDKNIYIDKNLIMQIMANLIESAIQLADTNSIIKVQLGIQAGRFIFRVITQGRVIPLAHINQILDSPDQGLHDLPYSLKLRFFFSNQIATHHEGQLSIKPSLSKGMQINLLIPTSESVQDNIESIQLQDSIPERKPSTVMIYDSDPLHDDVDYSFLEIHGYELIYCTELTQIHTDLDMVRVDLIILTTRQHDDSINNYVEELRQKRYVTKPILVLSTYNSEDERIRSIKSGVDTYLALPISSGELIVQVENLFERSKLPERVQEPLTVGKLYIDFAQRQVAVDGKNIDLTRIEYDLLCHLALNMGQTLSHSELLAEVWGPEYRDEKQYLWVNMSRLRRKLENTEDKIRYVFTQPGVGYILKNDQ